MPEKMKSIFKIVVLSSVALLFVTGCSDKPNPVITLNGDDEMTIYIGDTWTEPGATAVDYKGRDISSDIEISGTVPETSGHTTIDYTVSDKKGGFSVEQRGVSRGFKNTDLEGIYSVEQYTNNGGGTQIYTATITAGTGDIVSITLDNSNSIYAPVVMDATISATGRQASIPDQTSGSCNITLGQYDGYLDNSTGELTMHITFQTFCGSITYNHDATWTKQ
jgi:hypothetical protein